MTMPLSQGDFRDSLGPAMLQQELEPSDVRALNTSSGPEGDKSHFLLAPTVTLSLYLDIKT